MFTDEKVQNYSKFLLKNESVQKREEKYVMKKSNLGQFYWQVMCGYPFGFEYCTTTEFCRSLTQSHGINSVRACVCVGVRGREGRRKGGILATSKNILI